MAKITKIVEQNYPKKLKIFVEGKFCVSFYTYRKKDIENILNKKIVVGEDVDCEKLKDVVKYLWKYKYNRESWKLENERKKKVLGELKMKIPNLEFKDIGFGTNTIELLKRHPKDKGSPDVLITYDGKELIRLEITGKRGCGRTLWIRPDKIEYAKNHKFYDIWYAHTCDKEGEIWFIKPDLNKNYSPTEVEVRGGKERFVIFYRTSEEVKNVDEFTAYLKNKINSKQ